MAKLKLWVRNLIISLVLVASLSGVGVGLYFLCRPKPEQVAPRELTPAQKEFVNVVSQSEQKDVEHTVYDGIVLSDGTTTSTIALQDIVGQKGDYVVVSNTNNGNQVEIYQFVTSNANSTSAAAQNSLTLSRVAATAEFDDVLYDSNGSLAIGGHFAKVQKDGNEFIIDLATGATVMQKSDYEETYEDPGYVGSYVRSLAYFGNNILIVSEYGCTSYTSLEDFTMERKYVVYNLENKLKPLIFNDENGYLVDYAVDESHAVFISTQNTTAYSTSMEDGEWQTIFDPISNVFEEAAENDEILINSVYGAYKRAEFSTLEFVPNSDYVVVSKNTITTEDRVSEDNQNREVYDVAHYDSVWNVDVLVGTNNRLWNYVENTNANIAFYGLVEAKESNIAGYFEFVVKRISQFNYDSAACSPYATYYDTDFNHIVTYDYDASGDIIGVVGDVFVSGNGDASYFINTFGELSRTLSGYHSVSTTMYNSTIVLQRIGADLFYLKDLASDTLFGAEENYALMTEITGGKVVAYAKNKGFYEINLDTMVAKPIYNFDIGCINLVVASAGLYLTHDVVESEYTLFFTNGTKYQHIKSYSFRQIDEYVYVELVYTDDSTELLRTKAMGKLGTYTTEQANEKFVITIVEPEDASSGASATAGAQISQSNANKDATHFVNGIDDGGDGRDEILTYLTGDGSSIARASASYLDGSLNMTSFSYLSTVSLTANATADDCYPTYTFSLNIGDIMDKVRQGTSIYAINYYSQLYGLKVAVMNRVDVTCDIKDASGKVVGTENRSAGRFLQTIDPNVDRTLLNEVNEGNNPMPYYLVMYCPYAFIMFEMNSVHDSDGGYNQRNFYMGFRKDCFVSDMSGWGSCYNNAPNPAPGRYYSNGDEIIPTNDLFAYKGNSSMKYGYLNSRSKDSDWVIGQTCLSVEDSWWHYKTDYTVKFTVSPYSKEIKRYYLGLYQEGSYYSSNFFDPMAKGIDLMSGDSMLKFYVSEEGLPVTGENNQKKEYSNAIDLKLRDSNLENTKISNGENNSTPSDTYKITKWEWKVRAHDEIDWEAPINTVLWTQDSGPTVQEASIEHDGITRDAKGARYYDDASNLTGLGFYDACCGWWMGFLGAGSRVLYGKYDCFYYLKITLENKLNVAMFDIYRPNATTESGKTSKEELTDTSTPAGKVLVANLGPNGYIKYGFTTNNTYYNNYMNSYVGEPRKDFSNYTKNDRYNVSDHTFGYWLDGYGTITTTTTITSTITALGSTPQLTTSTSTSFGTDTIITTDGKWKNENNPLLYLASSTETTSSGSILGDFPYTSTGTRNYVSAIYPRQSPHQYKVTYHYINSSYNGDILLPTAEAETINSAYTSLGQAAKTESRNYTYNGEQIDFWQMIDNGGSASENNVMLPRGYGFAEWYSPSVTNTTYFSSTVKLTTANSGYKFGYYNSAPYGAPSISSFDAIGARGTSNGTKSETGRVKPSNDSFRFAIDLYAIYTPRTYNVQINLTESSNSVDIDCLNRWSNYTFLEESSKSYTIGNVQLGQKYDQNNKLLLPTMYASKNSKFYYDLTLVATSGKSAVEREDKNLSGGKSTERMFAWTADKDTLNNTLTFSTLAAYSMPNGSHSFFTGIDGSNNTTIVLNVQATPMQYAVGFKAELPNNHAYNDSTDDAINSTLRELSVELGGEDSTTTIPSEHHDWGYNAQTSWKSAGSYTVTYNNFFPGYKLDLGFVYVDIYGDQRMINAHYYDDENNQNGVYYGTYDNSTDSTHGDVITFEKSGTSLVVTFGPLGFCDFWAVDTGNELHGALTPLSTDVTSDSSHDYNIYIISNISTQPYQLALQIGTGESAETVDLTNEEGKPTGTISGNNSVSEYINGRVTLNGITSEIAGYGSTVILSTNSAMYKILHTRYYVPNQYISGFKINYNETEILSTPSGTITVGEETYNSFADYMTKLFITMGETKTADPDLGIFKYDNKSKYNLKAIDGTTLVVNGDANGDAKLDAVLRLLYGLKSDGVNQVLTLTTPGGTASEYSDDVLIGDSKYFVYSLIPIKDGSGQTKAYLIVCKYDDESVTDNDLRQRFGIKTGIMFNIDGDWSSASLNKYTAVVETTEYQSTLGWKVSSDDSVDGEHATISLNANESHVGYFAGQDHNEYTFNGQTSKYHGIEPYDVGDGYVGYGMHAGETDFGDQDVIVAPADYFVFNFNAEKGYYFKEISIIHNETTYVLTFVGFNMVGGAQLKPVYKLNSSGEGETFVFADNDVTKVIVLDDLLLQLEVNQFAATEGSSLILKVGFVHNAPGELSGNCRINASYAAYTLMRIEASFETRIIVGDSVPENIIESNLIYYEKIGTKLIVKKNYQNNGTTYNPQIAEIRLPAELDIISVGIMGDSGTSEAGTSIENRAEIIYLFFESFKIDSLLNKIELESYLAANISYELVQNAIADGAGNPTYKTNTAIWQQENKDLARTRQDVVSTVSEQGNTNNVISVSVSPISINNIITSAVDFDGKQDTETYYEETLNEVESTLNNLEDIGLYYTNPEEYSDTKTTYAGQIVSGGTQLNFAGTNQASATDNGYYQYGIEYSAYGNSIELKIHTAYGYEFAGIDFRVKFRSDSTKLYRMIFSYATLREASEGNIVLNVTEVGDLEEPETRVIGTYKFTEQDGYYSFIITITNFDSTEFGIKINYLAKTFDVVYDTNATFGTSAIAEEQQTRKFVYNVKSEINAGTSGLESGEAVSYTRDGYNQVGWSFATNDGTDERFEKTADGKTPNISNYANGASEGSELSVDYATLLYRVGLVSNGTDAQNFAANDAGYAWYLSLGEGNADVFGTTNAGVVKLYAIWNAKTYKINLTYNDEGDGKGSSTATKFTVSWVFDAKIVVKDATVGELNFEAASTSLAENSFINTYRLGYTFDGWYFVDGTFSTNDGWDVSNRVFDNTNKTALSLESNTLVNTAISDVKLNAAAKLRMLSAWEEGENEYTETLSGDSVVCRTVYPRNGDLINFYAKWTANQYSFIFDANGAETRNNIESVRYQYDQVNPSENGYSVETTSPVTIAETNAGNGEIVVTFDQDIPLVFNTYAYRYGYRFTGWYATRLDGGDEDPRTLVEGSTFDVDFLMQLQTCYTIASQYNRGNKTQLELLKVKRVQGVVVEEGGVQKVVDFENSNLVETQSVTPSTITREYKGGAERVETQSYTYGNLVLLHARWEALTYTIYIDLNNWNHRDYEWTDADYMVAGDENTDSVNGNVVYDTKLKFEIVFDELFETGKLYLNGVEQTGQITYSLYGTQYTTTSTNAFDKMCEILYAYGYDLGVEFGREVYAFSEHSSDGNGFENTDKNGKDLGINKNVHFDYSHLEDAKLAQTFDGEKYEFVKLLRGETVSTLLLTNIDKSGGDGHVGDMHNEETDDQSFGTRTFTLFALWTAKEFDILNNVEGSSKEVYLNNLGVDYTQEIDRDTTIIGITKPVYNTNINNLTEPVNTTFSYFAPTGQYAKKITLYVTNDRNVIVAYVIIEFGWDSVNHRTYLEKVSVEYPENIVEIGSDIITTDNTTTYDVTYSNTAWLQHVAEQLKIEMSEYKQKVVVGENAYNSFGNIWNNSHDVNAVGNNISTMNYSEYARNSLSNFDINVIKFTFTDLKSNIKLVAVNEAQTYDVDYYRLIRPTEGYQTHYGEDSTDEATYGHELWDSEFLNDWNQYEVYRTETYRYGEYASTTYGYASNFGFDNWYYYEGHIANENYNEYEHYSEAGKIYVVSNSDSIPSEEYNHLFDYLGHWTAYAYTWDDAEGYYKYQDEDGNVFTLSYDQAMRDRIAALNGGDSTLIVHVYTYDTYNDNGTPRLIKDDYRFNRKPVAGNMSIVGLYVPAATHNIKYFVWNGSEYAERVDSSNEYILGSKRVAAVKNTAGAAGLNTTYNHVEYWELGTNTEYYYVGFSGFNRIEGENPTEMAAVAFLLQFVNKNNYNSYNLVNNKLTIEWSDLKAIIANGIVFNGKTYVSDKTTAVELAKDLLRKLVRNYSSRVPTGETHSTNRIYGTNATYLYDLSVLENMSFYDVIKPIIDKIEIPAQTGDEIVYENKTMSYSAAVELYNKYVFNLVYLYHKSTEISTEAIEEEFNQLKAANELVDPLYENSNKVQIYADEIVQRMTVADLNVLLDSIATDYFGFVYKNPTDVISDWPDDAYFAGWYRIDAILFESLMDGDNKGSVLTYNSDTWGESSPNCVDIVGENVDENGNVTYILDGGFEVTRFNTINQITGDIDVLSRVDNEILVFAAFNKYKFEFEAGVIAEYDNNGKKVTNKNKLSGFNFGMDKNSIQWGKKEVRDIDGNPYQYSINDVKFVALEKNYYDGNAETTFVDLYKINKNLPTSLETTMKRNNINSVYNDLTSLYEEIGSSGNEYYVFAFVYDIKEISIIKNADGEATVKKVFDDGEDFKINIVSSNGLRLNKDKFDKYFASGTQVFEDLPVEQQTLEP